MRATSLAHSRLTRDVHGQVPECGAVSGDVDVSLGNYTVGDGSGKYLKVTDTLLDDLTDAKFRMEKGGDGRHKTYHMPRACICVDEVKVTLGSPVTIRGGRRQQTELKRVERDLREAQKLWAEERRLHLARAAAAAQVAQFHAPASPGPSAADAPVAIAIES